MSDARSTTETPLDVAVVGAGFAGLYSLYRLRERGYRVRVFEAGSGVGGTWYWNRYPGARCDVESLEYSYQFSEELQQEWEWSERYSPQPEILRYANHVADRFELRPHIQLDTRVESLHFDDASGHWTLRTEHDETAFAHFCVMATGCLSVPLEPEIPGLDTFREAGGEVYYTNRWPHEPVDLADKRIGVIGTGSSGIQVVPVLAERASELTVFQRTPNYSFPARNEPLPADEQRETKADYAAFRARQNAMQGRFGANWLPTHGPVSEIGRERAERLMEAHWEHGGIGFLAAFNDTLMNESSNDVVADFVRGKIAETVRDAETAALLSPTHAVGCKRPCVDTAYFETFNLPHVRLIDLHQQPIESATPTGLRVGTEEVELDCLVLATGFDAITGALLAIDIRGRGGLPLRDKWRDGPLTYLGLAVQGFPNLFTITGPGSPSVLTNMIAAIEQHVDWIADCLDALRDGGHSQIEATAEAELDWIAQVAAIADATLYPSCNSWYVGANVPGKPRVFMVRPGLPSYDARCSEIAAKGYDGFTLL